MFKHIHLSSVYLLILALIYVFFSTGSVLALSDRQKELISQGIYYYDPEIDPCANIGIPTTTGGSVTAGSKIYILGDSITNQSAEEIRTEFSGKQLEITSINASSGRAISYHSTDPEGQTGIDAVAADIDIISSSDVALVALGTNSGNEDLSVQIPALVTEMRAANPGIAIYWVNLFSLSNTTTVSKNGIITKLSSENKYKVIDAFSAGIELGEDKTHPTIAGNTTFAKTLASGLLSGGNTGIVGSGGVGSSGYNPISLTYPSFPNKDEIVTNLKKYISESFSSSPFASSPQYVDYIFSASEQKNVNPLLILSVAKQENGFGSGKSGAVENNNYFGMKESDNEKVQLYGPYIKFGTPEEGIEFFIGRVEAHVKTPSGNYSELTNFYEYLSIHQMGFIAYPNEYPAQAQGANATPKYLIGDPVMGGVLVSWDTTANDNRTDGYKGKTYNPGIYFSNSIVFINKITGLSLSPVPVRGTSTDTACQQVEPGVSGLVDSTGYAFPLEPQTKSVGGVTDNQTQTRHHDKTPAFDLFSTDSADVYAIFGGTPTFINTSFKGIEGCSTIQFLADDGFYYWYGHLKNVVVSQGVHIEVGTKMAEIADKTNFGSDCWGGGPHLHIDRGCSINGVPQTGGRDECRDPDFIPFLSSLYSRLPSNSEGVKRY